MEVVNAEKPKEGETAPPVINDPRIEEQWLMAAVQHAETYYKILTSVKDTKALKLTKYISIISDLLASCSSSIKY